MAAKFTAVYGPISFIFFVFCLDFFKPTRGRTVNCRHLVSQNGFYDYQLQEGFGFYDFIFVSIKLLINGFSSLIKKTDTSLKRTRNR